MFAKLLMLLMLPIVQAEQILLTTPPLIALLATPPTTQLSQSTAQVMAELAQLQVAVALKSPVAQPLLTLLVAKLLALEPINLAGAILLPC